MSKITSWDMKGTWDGSGAWETQGRREEGRRAGLSEAGLRRMRDVLNGHVASGAVPGLVALVSRGDDTRVEAMGTMHAGGAEPMRRDTIFRMASLTKPVTAAGVMILVEECRLRLDEPVDEWLPELAGRQVLARIDAPLDETVPAARPITVRDLLTFTFGFGVVLAAPDTYPSRPRSASSAWTPPHRTSVRRSGSGGSGRCR
ncbi:serine hydrolase domain-containing protein [Nonomuraea sp. NPDC050786]|uniref:serine hydrolase domain-containing protein n=1 Tax=Nonomuraea sp. NPDC050786 TaxID=3154840 RepID=UPI00340D9870